MVYCYYYLLSTGWMPEYTQNTVINICNIMYEIKLHTI